MQLTTIKTTNDIHILLGGVLIARIPAMEGTTDEIIPAAGGTKLVRTAAVPTDRMEIRIECALPCKHTVVPSVSYDGNPWGTDHEYKGLTRDGVPYTYAWHRTPAPGATASNGEGYSLAVYGEQMASGSIHLEEGQAVHRLLWPEIEEPAVLYSDEWGEAYYGTMEPRTEFTAWIFADENPKKALSDMLSHAFYHLGKKRVHENARNVAEMKELALTYATDLYTEDPDGFKGFSIGYSWRGTEWMKRPDAKYESGWCGQNISLAVSMLHFGGLRGDESMIEKGIQVLDSWIKYCSSDCGALYSYHDNRGDLIDACNLGTAALQYYEAADAMKELGRDGSAYEEEARTICRFIPTIVDAEGSAGVLFNANGEVIQKDGTAGAFLIPALVKTYERGYGEEYLACAKRMFVFYFREFDENGYGTSGALDSKCIDKESVIPLLKSALLLYKNTKEANYLAQAVQAAQYLSTWQWCQTNTYPEDSDLHAIGYDTFGGTSVSTSHLHQDAYALAYVPELYELAALTGNREWSDRARAAWYNACQDISDGTTVVGGTAVRPAGGSDEGFLHTRWGRHVASHKGWSMPFSVSQWLVAWPCAFRLEILRKLADADVLDE